MRAPAAPQANHGGQCHQCTEARIAGRAGVGADGRSQRLQHQVTHLQPAAAHAFHDVLRRRHGAGDDVHLDLEAHAAHAQRLAHAVLAVDDEFLRQDVQDLLVVRDRDRLRRLDDAVEFRGGVGAARRVREQPCLAPHDKGSDRVFDEVVVDLDAAVIEAADQAALSSSDGQFRNEFVVERGAKKRVLSSVRVVARDEQNRPEFLIALFDDVTDRRSLSKELENTKKFLELVVDNIPVSLIVERVSDGRYLLANRSAETILNRRREDATGDSLYALVEPMDLIEIRIARESHKNSHKDLPIVMRGFVSEIRRDETMGPDGKASRRVIISGQDYGKLLQIFFSVVHDPTQLNRQGPDTGPHYRSAIFTNSDEQKKVAEAYIAQLNAAKVYKKPIVTKVGPLEAFYPAEAYHQDYLTLHPTQPYIAYNDIPKVENLKKIFAENYIAKPTLVGRAKVTN